MLRGSSLRKERFSNIVCVSAGNVFFSRTKITLSYSSIPGSQRNEKTELVSPECEWVVFECISREEPLLIHTKGKVNCALWQSGTEDQSVKKPACRGNSSSLSHLSTRMFFLASGAWFFPLEMLRLPVTSRCNPPLTALSPQRGHISNMLCSFEADGRLKVSVFSFLCLHLTLPLRY